MRLWRFALIGAGATTMAFAVVGALLDRDVRPVGHVLFLAGVLLTHDAVLLPLAIGAGVLIGRWIPRRLRVPVRLAAVVAVTFLVVAVPLLLAR